MDNIHWLLIGGAIAWFWDDIVLAIRRRRENRPYTGKPIYVKVINWENPIGVDSTVTLKKDEEELFRGATFSPPE